MPDSSFQYIVSQSECFYRTRGLVTETGISHGNAQESIPGSSGGCRGLMILPASLLIVRERSAFAMIAEKLMETENAMGQWERIGGSKLVSQF